MLYSFDTNTQTLYPYKYIIGFHFRTRDNRSRIQMVRVKKWSLLQSVMLGEGKFLTAEGDFEQTSW